MSWGSQRQEGAFILNSCSGSMTLPQSRRQWEDLGIFLTRIGTYHSEEKRKTYFYISCSPDTRTCSADSRDDGTSWWAFWNQKCLRIWWSGQGSAEKGASEQRMQNRRWDTGSIAGLGWRRSLRLEQVCSSSFVASAGPMNDRHLPTEFLTLYWTRLIVC